MHRISWTTSALSWAGGEAIIRVDTLSAVFLPFAAGLWLLTVAVTPRASLDRGGVLRTALATLITLASFLTESASVLLVLSVASVWTFMAALKDSAHRYQRRIAGIYLGVSTLMFAIGVVLMAGPGAHRTGTAGMWCIVIAALIRKGIVPFTRGARCSIMAGSVRQSVQCASARCLYDRRPDRAARFWTRCE